MKLEDFDKDNQQILYLSQEPFILKKEMKKIVEILAGLKLNYIILYTENIIKLDNGTRLFFKTTNCLENLLDFRLNKVYVFDKHRIENYDYIKHSILIHCLIADNGILEEL